MFQCKGSDILRVILLSLGAVLLVGCGQTGRTAPVGGPGVLDRLRADPAVRDVGPWRFGKHGGYRIRSEHYIIYTTLQDPLTLHRLAPFMEAALRQYRRLSPVAAPSRPMPVYLFATRSQWEGFTRQTMGRAAEHFLRIRVGAYFANGRCVAYHINPYRTYSVLAHEGFHQFTAAVLPMRLPAWLDEGLACTFEGHVWQSDRIHFLPGSNSSRMATLKYILHKGRIIALPQLLSMHAGQVIGKEDFTAAFYAQAWALAIFLRQGPGLKYRKPLQRLLADAATGRWPLPATLAAAARRQHNNPTEALNREVSLLLFRYYFAGDMLRFEREFFAFLKQFSGVREIGRRYRPPVIRRTSPGPTTGIKPQ